MAPVVRGRPRPRQASSRRQHHDRKQSQPCGKFHLRKADVLAHAMAGEIGPQNGHEDLSPLVKGDEEQIGGSRGLQRSATSTGSTPIPAVVRSGLGVRSPNSAISQTASDFTQAADILRPGGREGGLDHGRRSSWPGVITSSAADDRRKTFAHCCENRSGPKRVSESSRAAQPALRR